MDEATRSWFDRQTPADFRGQFVLSRNPGDLPPSWRVVTGEGWHLAVRDLPVHALTDRAGFVGWCLGYPLADRPLALDRNAIDTFYSDCSGPWVLLLVGVGADRVLLDPGGQMPVVYDAEHRILASTPSLLRTAQPRDVVFERAIGFPDRDGWFPFGLTSRPNVRRLLPNHMLDLRHWTVSRHWPTADTSLAVRRPTWATIEQIHDFIERSLRIASERHRLALTITAGCDSRMVLTCARKIVPRSTCITYWNPGYETRDVHIARVLTRVAHLEHRFVSRLTATPEQIEEWLHRTGHAVCGGVMKGHRSSTQLEPADVVVTGMGGEIGRGYYYRRGDAADMSLTANALLRRLGVQPHSDLLEAGSHWLETVRGYDAFVKLDLLYVENRFGCWAAPQRFTNTTSAYTFTPFNYRPLIHSLLQLPHYYRWRDRLPRDLMQLAWPELRRVPINRYTRGWRGMKDRLAALARATTGPIRYRGGSL